MNIPLIILLSINIMTLGMSLARHGELRSPMRYNFFRDFFITLFVIVLLYKTAEIGL